MVFLHIVNQISANIIKSTSIGIFSYAFRSVQRIMKIKELNIIFKVFRYKFCAIAKFHVGLLRKNSEGGNGSIYQRFVV